MGLNWKGALREGAKGLSTVLYKQAENAWEEEAKEADFMRQRNLEALRQSNAAALQNDQQSFLREMDTARAEREEKRFNYEHDVDRKIAEESKIGVAKVSLEAQLKEQAKTLESKQEFSTLQANGAIPKDQSFEDWFSKKQYAELFAKKGLSEEVYADLTKKAMDMWTTLPERDQNAYDIAMAAAKNDESVAMMTYVNKTVGTLASQYKGTTPSKGEAGVLASGLVEKEQQAMKWAKSAPFADVFAMYKKSNPDAGDEEVLAMILAETGRKPTDKKNMGQGRKPAATSESTLESKKPFVLFEGWTPEARKKRRGEEVDSVLGF